MPSSTSQPWPNTCLGRGRPSACKMMGHVMVWKRMISLPIRWMSAGQYFRYRAVVLAPIAQSGNIVGERIQPHVHGMLGIKIDRHAPLDGGAADAQVLQAGPEEIVEHLVASAGRLDEVGVLLDIVDHPLLIFARPEEIGFLVGLFHGTAAVRQQPSLSCISVKKLSQGVQYQPS